MTSGSSRFVHNRLSLTAVLGMVLLGTGNVHADAGNTVERNPITVYTADAAGRGAYGLAEQLLQKARQQRQVRVIVGLRTIMGMEHTLSATQRLAQREALTRLQDSVAVRVFGILPARVDRFRVIPYMSMFVNASQLGRLLADRDVVSVQEDVPLRPALDPLMDSVPFVNAPQVWVEGFAGQRQVVAVLDSGVDKKHPMFSDPLAPREIVSEACYSTNQDVSSSVKIRSFCPQGATESTARGSGANCNWQKGGELCAHGTMVATLATGSGDIEDGIAPDARLISVQICSRRWAQGDLPKLQCFWTDLIKGLEHVYELRDNFKIAAVNISLGEGFYAATCDDHYPAETTLIANLRSAGIATVTIAGNDGKTGLIRAPGCISGAIAVGATTRRDLLWQSSNHSAQVKLLAPGVNVTAGAPEGSPCIGQGNPPYCTDSGTSLAAPHVTGAFALLKSAKKDATVEEIAEALACSGKTIDFRQSDAGPVPLDALAKPRIDLIAAFDHLINSRAERDWQFVGRGDDKDWSPLRGTWSVQSHAYRGQGSPGWIASTIANCHDRFQIVARVQATGNPDPNAPITLPRNGIFVGATIDRASKRMGGYWFYYVLNPQNPAASLAEVSLIDAHYEQNESFSSVSINRCSQSRTIANGSKNTLKVVGDGNTFSFWLNGALVCAIDALDSELGSTIMLVQRVPDPPGSVSFAIERVEIKTMRESRERSTIMDPTSSASRAALTRSGISSR